jgi:hypothetical protein
MNKSFGLGLIILLLGIVLVSGCTGQAVDRETTTPTTAIKTTTTIALNCRMVTETYEEEVPYTVQEPYQVQEPYSYYLQYYVVDSKLTTEWEVGGRGVFVRATVQIKNLDSEAGWFTVTYEFETLKDGKVPQSLRHYIEPDKTVTYIFEYDVDAGEDTQGRITSVVSDPVTKYRTVTNYRDVTKYRTETKTRTKQVCE